MRYIDYIVIVISLIFSYFLIIPSFKENVSPVLDDIKLHKDDVMSQQDKGFMSLFTIGIIFILFLFGVGAYVEYSNLKQSGVIK